jgi:CHASE2 domain-containing sensor protein
MLRNFVFLFLSLPIVSLWYRLFGWLFQYLFPGAYAFLHQDGFWHRFLHSLVFNLLIGLTIAGLLMFFQHYPLLMDEEDASLDLAMQINQEKIPPLKKQTHFVFLDIDNRTHKLWDEPLFTPRNHLQKLIAFAVASEARLVVVDVDLSQDTPIEGLPLPDGLQRHPYDQALYDYMANYHNYCKGKTTCPPIILTRGFRPLTEYSEKKETFRDWFRETPWFVHEVRPSFLESAVVQSTPYVQWASPLFWQSSYDTGVRRWWLFQPVCQDNQPDVIPSIQLLAATMMLDGTPKKAQDNINQALAQYKPKNCTSNEMPSAISSSQPIFITDNLNITEGTRGIRQRIIYEMSWLPPQSQSEKSPFRYVLYDYDDNTPERNVILSVVSAQPYLNLFQQNPHSAEALKNSIVVIGGSYAEGGDIHITPLGEMPGALIVINAIYSLLQYGEIKPWPNWAILLLIVGLIMVMSLFFTLGTSFLWLTFIGVLMTTIVFLLSVWQLKYGFWLNVVLPLLVVNIHQIAADFYDLRQKKS